jgi:hypothetical protein
VSVCYLVLGMKGGERERERESTLTSVHKTQHHSDQMRVSSLQDVDMACFPQLLDPWSPQR